MFARVQWQWLAVAMTVYSLFQLQFPADMTFIRSSGTRHGRSLPPAVIAAPRHVSSEELATDSSAVPSSSLKIPPISCSPPPSATCLPHPILQTRTEVDPCEPPASPFIVLLAEPVPEVPAGSAHHCYEVADVFPGHRAVTPGAVAALRAAGARFWYNPTCTWERADAVVVLNPGNGADVPPSILENMRSRAGLIYAGPNAIAMKFGPAPADVWIVPSTGVGEQLAVHLGPDVSSQLQFFAWPVGVDVEQWAPLSPRSQRRGAAIIYLKTEPPPELLEEVRGVLSAVGVTVVTELRYGSYELDFYRAALQKAGAMVVFSAHESQGAFLFEAWASEVPTFVFTGSAWQHEFEGRTWLSEPAPYLTPLTGAYWNAPAQLGALFSANLHFQPRRWLLEHGSLEVVGRALVDDVRQRLRAKCNAASAAQ